MTISRQVSVVMPVHNGEAFVEAALRSVLAQEDIFEVLLHDDGSTDGTFDLLTRMAHQEPRLRVSRGINRGAASARNHGLERASGEFIAFLDHDDLWPADRMRRQINLLAADPTVDAVLGHTLIFEHHGQDDLPLPSSRSRQVLCGLLQAALFRRRAMKPLGGFDPELAAADDFDLFLRFIEGGAKLKIDAEVAVHYRLHQNQWTADGQFASLQTVRALHKSLLRRRRNGISLPEWRA